MSIGQLKAVKLASTSFCGRRQYCLGMALAAFAFVFYFMVRLRRSYPEARFPPWYHCPIPKT